jgi:hypothetical protein
LFRPGLEALLIIGKFVDNPDDAAVWRDRLQDRDKYQRTFSGRELVSQSLPGAQEFRKVLSRLNEEFMHPNPDFAYRDMTVQNEGQAVLVRIELFNLPRSTKHISLLI